MKKTLLIFLALPFLLSAQSVTVSAVKDYSFVKQVIERKNLKERGPFSIVMANSSVKKMLQSSKSEESVLTRAGANNELPDSIYEYYYDEGEKILGYKKFLTYYDFGRIKQEINYYVDGEGNDIPTYKLDYTYVIDAGIVAVEVIYSSFNDIDNKWEPRSKECYKFLLDYYEIPLEYVSFNYNAESGEWEPGDEEMETTIEYDSENRPIVVIMHYTKFEGEDEDFSIRFDITYNEQGLYSTIILTESYDNGEEWMEKTENKYNDKKQLIEEIFSYYDSDLGEWVSEGSFCYEYDEKGNLIKETHGDYVIIYENIYLEGNSNDVISSIKSAIYPNPVSDVLFIKLEGADNAVVTLVNAAGGVVMQQAISGQITSIPVQSLSKGYYFLIIKTGKGVITHKVIKI